MRNHIISHIVSSTKPVFDMKPLIIGAKDTNSIMFKAIEEYAEYNIVKYQDTNNVIDYDIYLTTNPEEYMSSLDTIKINHLHDFIYITNPPAKNIKKEDRFLIQQKLSWSNIIFRNKHIKALWFPDDTNTEFLEYGIPDLERTQYIDKHSVIVINYNQSHNINLLYYNIRQQFPDAVMLTSIDKLSYSQICTILQEYKICITSGDSYNVLCAAYNNCIVFSTEQCEGVNSVNISSFDEIFDLIPPTLHKYNQAYQEKISNNLLKQYSFDTFSHNFSHISNNILRKPVII